MLPAGKPEGGGETFQPAGNVHVCGCPTGGCGLKSTHAFSIEKQASIHLVSGIKCSTPAAESDL